MHYFRCGIVFEPFFYIVFWNALQRFAMECRINFKIKTSEHWLLVFNAFFSLSSFYVEKPSSLLISILHRLWNGNWINKYKKNIYFYDFLTISLILCSLFSYFQHQRKKSYYYGFTKRTIRRHKNLYMSSLFLCRCRRTSGISVVLCNYLFVHIEVDWN